MGVCGVKVVERNGEEREKKVEMNDLWVFLLGESGGWKS